MVWQYIIIAGILLICLALTARHIYRTLTDKDSACKGCQLKEACQKHGRRKVGHADHCDAHTPHAR